MFLNAISSTVYLKGNNWKFGHVEGLATGSYPIAHIFALRYAIRDLAHQLKHVIKRLQSVVLVSASKKNGFAWMFKLHILSQIIH